MWIRRGTYPTLPAPIQFFSQEAGIEYGGLERPEATEATEAAASSNKRSLAPPCDWDSS